MPSHQEVNAATAEFTRLAQDYLDDWAARHPDDATELGDHRFDGELPDLSEAALADERAALRRFTTRLGAIGRAAIPPEHRVDAAILANRLELRAFEIDELADASWDPLPANPGRAIQLLLDRDFAPAAERLARAGSRLAGVPGMLAAARARLRAMPRVHIETAIGQLGGAETVLTRELDAALAAAEPSAGLAASADLIARTRPAALAAVREHRDWLRSRLAAPDGFVTARIGAERFARKLTLTLHAAAGASEVASRARDDLDRVTGEITALAAELGGSVREVLDQLAADAPDDTTILALCREALAAQTRFTEEHRLVTVYRDPAEVIEMPEINRGVAVAYCDPPGSLETSAQPTFLAVSPTPSDWSPDRVASFYREYNKHMLHNLMVHEAMPGHYLQLAHSRRFTGTGSALRAAFWSGSFVEGWAVYAEELMVRHGYPGTGDPRRVRMQQLKMQLRMIINALLDAGVHGEGMTEDQAMALMRDRGFQEEGEAAGKWRRAQLTSAQLSTYYVGYTEVSDLAADLASARPGASERDRHDDLLGHGSPPARLLRRLLLPGFR